MKNLIKIIYLEVKGLVSKKPERVVYKPILPTDLDGELEFVKIVDKNILAKYDAAYDVIDTCDKQALKMKSNRLQELAGISAKK